MSLRSGSQMSQLWHRISVPEFSHKFYKQITLSLSFSLSLPLSLSLSSGKPLDIVMFFQLKLLFKQIIIQSKHSAVQ